MMAVRTFGSGVSIDDDATQVSGSDGSRPDPVSCRVFGGMGDDGECTDAAEGEGSE